MQGCSAFRLINCKEVLLMELWQVLLIAAVISLLYALVLAARLIKEAMECTRTTDESNSESGTEK